MYNMGVQVGVLYPEVLERHLKLSGDVGRQRSESISYGCSSQGLVPRGAGAAPHDSCYPAVLNILQPCGINLSGVCASAVRCDSVEYLLKHVLR